MVIARRIGTALTALSSSLGNLFETLILLGGAALVSYGAYEIYPPAGAITAGVLLIAGSILRARGS